MPDPIKPLTSTPLAAPITRKAYNKSAIPNRPSYTPTNALQFKDVFDKMLLTQENQEIHSSVTGFKATTLYIKANDALKWLAECHPTDAEKYMMLKGRVSIRREEDRILIYFRSSVMQMISKGAVPVGGESSTVWKEELQKWIETAQDGDIWERRGISMSQADKVWLLTLLAGLGPGVEVDIEKPNEVRIMR